MKILVVDDSVNDRVLLTERLKSEGYDVITASNGVEGLEKAIEAKPDLVISDILMPEIDGFGLCRELKKNIETIITVITDYRAGKIARPMPGILDEREYLSLYSRRLMKILEDKVGELESANNKLEVALAELKTLDDLKDNILSNVTHELRTPLTHAIGYLELAMGETEETKKMDLLRKCKDALRHENAVIGRLVESAYAGKGLLKPVFKTMNVGEMINEIIQALSPKAQAYTVEVSSEVEDKLFAKGDSNQIKHVLENLLDNAIKFNRKGGKVEISASVKDEMVEVCFNDTGIGIPEDKLNKLFERMYQVNSDTTRKFGGIGIGLSIAKFIVEGHKGRIWVKSKAGEGSSFCFTIPASKDV